ncbi:MAG: type III-A CRISPR-associated protein Csm2 [Lewinellaceae bacterium]|nr:type III-A CRISPR-associated protein Csm2 [Phaeodactylibacter sp.]MCB9035373.1 type III-A CRISPR-associated protein Csm2 [Lewinellaceae bacterium]
MKPEDLNFDTIQAQELNQLAKDSASTFVQKDRLKTHQLRNVFSAIEKMRTLYKQAQRERDEAKKAKKMEDLKMQLIFLKPKIAYAAGRQRSVRYNFFPLVEAAVDAVDNAKDEDGAYQKFFALMESVVGYHKFFEAGK